MNSRGFTLLEVLIATTLIGIMMVLLFGSLRIGASAWDSGEHRLDRTGQMLVVQSFLRRHLASAIPWRVGDPERLGAQFLGTRNGFDYVGFLPAQIKTGLYRFHFFVDRRGDRRSLKLGVTALDDAGDTKPIEDIEILGDLDDVKFAYLLRLSPSAEPTWVEEWTEDMIPSVVSIRVRPLGEEPWPAILVAPRLDSLS